MFNGNETHLHKYNILSSIKARLPHADNTFNAITTGDLRDHSNAYSFYFPNYHSNAYSFYFPNYHSNAYSFYFPNSLRRPDEDSGGVRGVGAEPPQIFKQIQATISPQ
jgi:hypothetical protein